MTHWQWEDSDGRTGNRTCSAENQFNSENQEDARSATGPDQAPTQPRISHRVLDQEGEITHANETRSQDRQSHSSTVPERQGETEGWVQREEITRLAAEVEALKQRLLPVDPLFDLQVAATLIPMHYDLLIRFLSRHKDNYPALYRMERNRTRRRLLSGEEIKRIRQRVLRGPGNAT